MTQTLLPPPSLHTSDLNCTPLPMVSLLASAQQQFISSGRGYCREAQFLAVSHDLSSSVPPRSTQCRQIAGVRGHVGTPAPGTKPEEPHTCLHCVPIMYTLRNDPQTPSPNPLPAIYPQSKFTKLSNCRFVALFSAAAATSAAEHHP